MDDAGNKFNESDNNKKFEETMAKYEEIDRFIKHIHVALIKVSHTTQLIGKALEQIDLDMKLLGGSISNMEKRIQRLEEGSPATKDNEE